MNSKYTRSIQLSDLKEGIRLLTELPNVTLRNNKTQGEKTFSKPCLLLSKHEAATHAAQFSYFTANPTQCLSFKDQNTLQEWHKQQHVNCSNNTTPQLSNSFSKAIKGIPFHSGWAGVYFYPEINSRQKPSNPTSPDIAEFHYYPWVICLNHNTNILYLLGDPDDCAQAAFSAIKHQTELPPKRNIANDSYLVKSRSVRFQSGAFHATWNKSQYLAAFTSIQNYLISGDCYQVNLTHPHTSHYSGSALDAVFPLHQALNPSFGCYFEGTDFELISISPERFMSISPDGQIEAKPIKGTIGRSDDPIKDQALIDELKNSQKNQAENLMIVDLLRNDLSISATPNSVKVKHLFELETHPNVHHLVSTIHAEMKDELSAPQVINNAFPGGSITGAPKKRAMEIIEELEAQPRSLYCGSFGYYSDTGHTDFNILIRSLEFRNNTITCWGGGGITIDSDCNEEYEESLTKVRQIMTTIENI